MFAPPTTIYSHGPGLIRSLFIEVPVPSLESEWSYICVLEVSSLPLFTVFLLHLGTVWYFVFFITHVEQGI